MPFVRAISRACPPMSPLVNAVQATGVAVGLALLYSGVCLIRFDRAAEGFGIIVEDLSDFAHHQPSGFLRDSKLAIPSP